MSENKDKLVLGLTGSFGSGCTTLSHSLEKLGFTRLSLSSYVRKVWSEKTGKQSEDAPKSELQDIGDKLREEKGDNYLATLAVAEISSLKEKKWFVIDSIRNLEEIAHFRDTFPNFYLIAVDSSPCFRWERVKYEFKRLGKTEDDFKDYDKRDKNEEWTTHGQQVELCVDDADLMIVNDEQFATEGLAEDKLKAKIEPYVNLLSGQRRPPTPFESYMNLAYSASLMSQCIKRRVGAVIVDERKEAIVAMGYNENPSPIPPCITKYFQCYRDIHKINTFKRLERKGEKCPKCGQAVKNVKPPFLCQNTIEGNGTCNFDLDQHYNKDKVMSRCTALHAEERAILTAGSRNIEDCTIYTTTFPCFTCSQKIAFSKLRSVVYVEPYPDPDSIQLLIDAKITVRKFEGIKAKAFFRIFGPWQREVEMGINSH